MGNKLFWNTVTPQLAALLKILMSSSLFDPFRLVGGTSMSLQLGHRESVDIDLFTDNLYDTIDFNEIDIYMRSSFKYVSDKFPGPVAMGCSYLVGDDLENSVKLDLFYTDTFIQPVVETEGIRMATIEEIIAMKVDIIQRYGRKKDFWDLHEVMDKYSIGQMIGLHKARFPYNHDEQLIRTNFVDFVRANMDPGPTCLRGNYWELIQLDIVKWAQ